MNRIVKFLCALAAAGAFGAPVAAKAPNPAPSVEKILAGEPASAGIFAKRMEGSVWHLQSGVTCPAAYTNVNLWAVEIYEANGFDVGCDYGRNGGDGKAVAKLTVFVIKAADDDTVDSAFARYQAEVKAEYPLAVVKSPAPDTGSFKAQARSEAYEYQIAGHPAYGVLVVGLRDGWIVEIRGTRLLDAPDAAETAADDLKAIEEALLKSMATISSEKAT